MDNTTPTQAEKLRTKSNVRRLMIQDDGTLVDAITTLAQAYLEQSKLLEEAREALEESCKCQKAVEQHVFPEPHHDEGCTKCGGFEGEPCEPPTGDGKALWEKYNKPLTPLNMTNNNKPDCPHENTIGVSYRCCLAIECEDCGETISKQFND